MNLVEADVGRKEGEVDGSAKVYELNGGGRTAEHILRRGSRRVQYGNALGKQAIL